MPAITLVLNTNHQTRGTVLSSAPSQAYLLNQARNKFRSKGLSTVFRRGGVQLLPGEELPDGETQVWIGKGEEYCGPPTRTRVREEGDVAQCRTIASRSFIDEQAVKQLQAVAELPDVRRAVGMPDLHPGSRFPIGCAIIADGVYPALIGSDIGCGIAVYRLSSLPSRLDPGKIAAKLVGLDDPWDGDVKEWLGGYGVQADEFFLRDTLGTVGRGNHFAEICRVESIADEPVAAQLGITPSDLYLMVHSGSRNIGSSILASQTSSSPSGNPYHPSTSPSLPPYLSQHDTAVLWAIANRDLIAHRIATCLSLPTPLVKIVDVTHNSVTAVEAEDGVRKWLHRKGAAPTDKGVVPCPGSRGDFSWLLTPTGDGVLNANSLAHGAGRLRPRTAMHAPSSSSRNSDLRTTSLDSHVICDDHALLIEEQPEAYKSVECVVADLEEAGVARRGVCLRPVVTYKCRR